MAPGREWDRHAARTQPRQIGHESGLRRQQPAIRVRVREREHEAICWIVPALEAEPALECLGVANSHFQLNGRSKPTADDQRIPGARFEPATYCWERMLAEDAERGMRAIGQSSQPCGVSGVSDRTASRVGADREIHAEDGTELGRLDDCQVHRPPSLHLDVVRARHPDDICELLLRPSRRQAGLAKLVGDLADGAHSPARTSNLGSLKTAHAGMLTRGDWRRLNSFVVGLSSEGDIRALRGPPMPRFPSAKAGLPQGRL